VRHVVPLLLCAVTFGQDARPISLRDAVQIALEQNPEITLSRIQQTKAEQTVQIAKGAFSPVAFIGSGLGYTDGIPQSVEGTTPSVLQAGGRMTLYDKPSLSRIQQAKEGAEVARYVAADKEDEIAFQVASTYLDFERSSRLLDRIRAQIASLKKIETAVRARVDEGVEIPLAHRRASLDVASAEQQLSLAVRRREVFQFALIKQLGLDPDIPLTPMPDDSKKAELPDNAQSSTARAIANSPVLKGLDANIRAKQTAIKVEKGARYPRLDLVAQYSLLAKFNNFEEYFNRFQRHNSQAGVALRVPLFTGKAVSARIGQAKIEEREARAQREAKQAGIEIETRRSHHEVEEAQAALKIARMEAAYASEAFGITKMRFDEGQVALDRVELARIQRTRASQSQEDAEYALRRTQLNLLRRTGDLATTFR